MPDKKQPTKKEPSMNAKQKRFADEYLISGNATEAAIKAGYSKNTASVIGCENLIKPNIKNYISERQNKLAAKTEITQQRVIEEYAKIAFGDIRKVFTAEGALKPLHEIEDDTAGAIASIESLEEKEFINGQNVAIGTSRKVKMWDKLRALDGLCKVLGFNAPDKTEGTMTIRWEEEKTYEANKKANGGS